MTDVKVLANWNGWCDPCEVERPLVLTEHGRRGVRAWLSGIHYEDRGLHLTCRVCGLYQVVDRVDEADAALDEAEVAVAAPTVPLILATALRPARSVVVASKTTPSPAALPAPRRPRPMVLTVKQHEASVLSMLAEGFDVVSAGR